MNDIKIDLGKRFFDLYDSQPDAYFYAPGRVNLIGEHTDYTGGVVFPVALSIGTYVAARKRSDSRVRAFSVNFEDMGIIEFQLENLVHDKEHDWVNYPKGVMKTYVDEGYKLESGVDLVFYGNIPNGAGLSSSASIELATSVMISSLYGHDVDIIKQIGMCKITENDFIGVSCGIMDQFIIGAGKKGHALLLDTHTLEYSHYPLDLEGMKIVIINSGVKRELSSSDYNVRIDMARKADEILRQKGYDYIGKILPGELHEVEKVLANEDLFGKIRHIVTENDRTKRAALSLEMGDLSSFGELMIKSHESLRDDFDVSTPELDALVEIALDNGSIGSRMTGAGFGGCTVNIVPKEKVKSFIESVKEGYSVASGRDAEFYIVESSDGARRI